MAKSKKLHIADWKARQLLGKWSRSDGDLWVVTELGSLQSVQKTAIEGQSIEIPETACLILHASPKGPYGKSVFVHRANGRLSRIARFFADEEESIREPKAHAKGIPETAWSWIASYLW